MLVKGKQKEQTQIRSVRQDEIRASVTLTGVQLAVDTCPDPHRRGNVKITCGNQQAEAGMLGHNDITNFQQDYNIATYCKASSTQEIHITVSVNPRGCTQMTLTEGAGSISIKEVTP